MSIITVTATITRKYLLNKSKSDLADMVLRMLDERDWRDIKTAPKDGTPIIGWCKDFGMGHENGLVGEARFDTFEGFWRMGDEQNIELDMWQPFPAPPVSPLPSEQNP